MLQGIKPLDRQPVEHRAQHPKAAGPEERRVQVERVDGVPHAGAANEEDGDGGGGGAEGLREVSVGDPADGPDGGVADAVEEDELCVCVCVCGGMGVGLVL